MEDTDQHISPPGQGSARAMDEAAARCTRPPASSVDEADRAGNVAEAGVGAPNAANAPHGHASTSFDQPSTAESFNEYTPPINLATFPYGTPTCRSSIVEENLALTTGQLNAATRKQALPSVSGSVQRDAATLFSSLPQATRTCAIDGATNPIGIPSNMLSHGGSRTGGNISAVGFNPTSVETHFAIPPHTAYSHAASMSRIIPNLTSAAMQPDTLSRALYNNTAAYQSLYSQANIQSPIAPPPTSVFGQAHISSTNFPSISTLNAYGQPGTANVNLTPSQIASRQVITKDLPPFSGRPEDWPLFITNYEQSTERCGFSEQENLIRLQKCLKGPALEAVRGRLMMPATVGMAISTLRMLYGRPDIIHQSMQSKLRAEPAVQSDKLETLVAFSLAVQNYCATMQAVGLVNYLNDPVLLNDLVAKLPSDQKLNWGRHRLSMAHVDISVFDDWLFTLATYASQVTATQYIAASNDNTNELKRGNRSAQKTRIMVHDVLPKGVETNERAHDCQKCGARHKLSDCAEFVALSSRGRWAFIRENKLCLRCFKSHFIRRCGLKHKCGIDGCKMPHHPLLHTAAPRGENVSNEQVTLHHKPSGIRRDEKQRTLFRYVAVTVSNGSKSVDTYALIDEGAACTLMEKVLADDLGLIGPTGELCLRWTGEITQSELSSKFVTCEIASTEAGAHQYKLRSVRTVSNLGLPAQTVDGGTIKRHAHLAQLPIRPYSAARARILIGVDNAKLCVPLEIKEDSRSNLVATKCRLGWSVYGREKSGHPPTAVRVMHVCSCESSSRDRMDEQMKRYFSIDAIGINAPMKTLQSKEDERALQIMEKSTKYLPSEKRWETGLLWKHNDIDLPDSFQMAHRRLICLESKMKRDPQLSSFIIEKIGDYKRKGYIRKLQKNEVTKGGRSWYLPIFTVLNANKNKTRLVWDAAAKVGDVALNGVLLKGPDFMASLLGILIRFREKRFAIAGDIREMFHQIKVKNDDQIAQRFLWRNGDSTKEPEIYAMTVMTFGASCSPSLANYVKNRNAKRFAESHSTAVQSIVDNTFVDDWLQSADTEEELMRLATAVHWIHKEGGFEMRNWVSNSKRTLATLSANNIPSTKCFNAPEATIEKVLGMWWQPESDELTFKENFGVEIFDESSLPSKRQILRTIMKIFDPLGLLGYMVIQAKIILQEVWRSGVGWDEPVRDSERKNWFQWVRRVPSISDIKIPRCCALTDNSENNQLHIFVDASINAYAAVAYLRTKTNGGVRCCLLASKTRVTPLKPISIPRLELMAAVLGLRLAKFIRDQLTLYINQRIFWTDSKNVIYWIRSDARKYHQFVALRIGEILEGSNVNEWRWLRSAENVADEGTKWNVERKFDDNARWFNGPAFLCETEITWPVTELPSADGDEAELLLHVDLTTSSSANLSIITPDAQRFSTWEKYRATQRCILRFLRLLVKTPASSPRLTMLLEADDMERAELILILRCQEESFDEEMKCLQRGETLSRKNLLYKLSPYLDDLGVLRVRGRIDAAEGVAVNTKRPIILPRTHTVTHLIIDFFHRKYHHHHNEIVVNEVRQRFFVPALRTSVRQCARRCQLCRNRKATPQPPQMGDLPVERISPFTHPFTFTGVDYFGPINVAVGRRREKRWGVLFTCLTTRGVHIEIASSLSTESFLLVFKQFVCRRGVPRRVVSDNGTNFRGASREIINEIEKLSSGELDRSYPTIEWTFIPPSAPHMGGAWERMIRSTKSILTEILPEVGLREDILRAAFADVENILNSRPLTYVPVESPEHEALTPNHFLLGTSSGIRETGPEDDSGPALYNNYRVSSQIANQFWKRWVRECLPCLTRRTKWFQPPPNPIELNDVVVIINENARRGSWPKGVVVDLHRGKDGQARSAVIRTSSGLCTRPVVKLAKLDVRSSN